MAIIVFVLLGLFVLLAIYLGFAFGLRMGMIAAADPWRAFLRGAAMIFGIMFFAGTCWFALIAFDGATDGVIRSIILMPFYSAIIWLPTYAFAFLSTRKSLQEGQKI